MIYKDKNILYQYRLQFESPLHPSILFINHLINESKSKNLQIKEKIFFDDEQESKENLYRM